MPTFDTLIYETPEPGIARIWLNRPEARNAQDIQGWRDLPLLTSGIQKADVVYSFHDSWR